MKFFNFSIGQKPQPNQDKLGRRFNNVGISSRFGLGFTIEEFNLLSQIKDYRTDLLNGTNWRPSDAANASKFEYIQLLKLVQKYSTSIFNDYIQVGFAILARIDGKIYYVSQNNYTKTVDSVKVHGYSNAEVFEFNEPNFFSGEKTIQQKCEAYQRLYNIALSCQKNGMSKSGFVSVISPKSKTSSITGASMTEKEVELLEKSLSESHGVSSDEQRNFLILNNEVDLRTISYDFSKLGILETKKLCEEYVCSKFGVPFVLLPSEGQTFANYEEANKILYENHSKYCEYFSNFVRNEIGLSIDYKTIAEAGKGIL
jgi:hypothetical protein